jgi:hypothetical protein
MRKSEAMDVKKENAEHLRRILMRVLIIVALYPILLGGVANMPQRYRAVWREMRREHREAIARDRARRLLLESSSRSQSGTKQY